MMEMQVIVFRVGEENYGIDVNYIKGIEKLIPIVRVPTSVPHIKGIINLRGKVIPVMSLRSKFNLPLQADTDNTRLLLVSYDDMDVALLVDEVMEIENVAEKNYFDTPIIVKSADTGYVKGIINNGDTLIIMIDHASLISVEEQSKMKDIISEDE